MNGTPIAGATGPTLTAASSGIYACTVTALNKSGQGAQTSAGITVTIAPPPTPAKLRFKLAKKRAVRTKAGKVAIVKVDLVNSGGTASTRVKLCGKLNKKAEKGLKAPKCVKVSSIGAGKRKVAKLRVKTRKTAKGLYKFRVKVRGAATGSLTAKVKVIPAKTKSKNRSKHHGNKA